CVEDCPLPDRTIDRSARPRRRLDQSRPAAPQGAASLRAGGVRRAGRVRGRRPRTGVHLHFQRLRRSTRRVPEHRAILPARARPPRHRLGPAEPAPVSAAWDATARLLWMLLPSQLRAVPDVWLVEATTSVSIRSCLRALSADDVSRLDFEGLEELIAAPFLGEV